MIAYESVIAERPPATSLQTPRLENINRGSRVASALDLLYNHSPHHRFKADLNFATSHHTSQLCPNDKPTSKKMLQCNVRETSIPPIGQDVFFWRDGDRWIGPVSVLSVEGHGLRRLDERRCNVLHCRFEQWNEKYMNK